MGAGRRAREARCLLGIVVSGDEELRGGRRRLQKRHRALPLGQSAFICITCLTSWATLGSSGKKGFIW